VNAASQVKINLEKTMIKLLALTVLLISSTANAELATCSFSYKGKVTRDFVALLGPQISKSSCKKLLSKFRKSFCKGHRKQAYVETIFLKARDGKTLYSNQGRGTEYCY
jgi:hypothetical protein